MASQDAEFAHVDANVGPDEPLPFRFRSDVTVTSSLDAKSSERKYFLRITKSNDVFELGEEEFFICSRLDGRVSFVELATSLKARFGTDITFEPFHQFAERLVDMGVIERVAPRRRSQSGARVKVKDPRVNMFRHPLFDPSRILDFVARFHLLARVLSWLALPLFFVACGIVLHDYSEMSVALKSVLMTLTILVQAPISLFIDNLFTKTVQGATAHYHGARIRTLGIHFVLGFFPRFYIDHDELVRLDRRAQMWTFFAPLLTRIMLFSVLLILWAALRGHPTGIGNFFLLLSHQSFAAFLLTVMPFWQSDGYHWLAAYFDQPSLYARSFRYLRMRLTGRPAPAEMTGVDRKVSIVFAILCLFSTVALIAAIFFYMGMGLELRMGGAGMAIFAVILSSFLIWAVVTRRTFAAVHAAATATRSDPRTNLQTSDKQLIPKARSSDEALVVPISRRAAVVSSSHYVMRRNPAWRRMAGLVLLVAFVTILFLPYQYHPGGDFIVLPNGQAEVTTLVDGQVSDILVKEGQFVEKGQVLGKLVNWEVARDLAVSEADLKKARAELERLKEGSKPEEIALAENQVKDAESTVAYEKAEMERTKALAAIGGASQRMFESANSHYEQTLAQVQVSRSNLDVVKSGATQAALAAAIENVNKLEGDIAYRRGQIERLTIKAPMSGRIVTPNIDLLYGKYLKIGTTFAQIDDTRVARVELNFPESDISYIKPGDVAEVKPWAYSDRIIYGKVVLIGSSAQTVQGNVVVRVTTEIPNEDGALRAQTTGYAKVEGTNMRVWEAYTLYLVHFFQVEVWSWIP
jgi:multidrug resistance efflux pump